MSDVNDLWNGLWARLSKGITDAKAPARTLALATESLTGGGAVRMVVLRGCDRLEPSIWFYTHAGSDKAFELADEPKAEVLLWDAAAQFQARMAVRVEVKQGTSDQWEALSSGARLNYVPLPPPGSAIAAPAVPASAGPEAFVVLKAEIVSADILDLSELPHRRARFHQRDDFTGQWVAP